MKITANNLSISYDLKKNVTHNNKTVWHNNSSKKSPNSYISSLINQKQEKEKELADLKNYQKQHISDLENELSDGLNNINDLVLQIEAYNKKISEASQGKDDLNITDEVSQEKDALNKTSEASQEKDALNKTGEVSQEKDALNKTSEVSQEKDALNKTGEVSQEKDALNKTGEVSQEKDALNKTGEIKFAPEVISNNPGYIELCKSVDNGKAELEAYKKTSAQQIENIKKEIEDLNNKILEAKNNNSQLIDSLV